MPAYRRRDLARTVAMMCGRYASYRQAQDLAEAFDVDDVTESARAVGPSYNVAPTQPIRIILDRAVDTPEETAQPAARRREMHSARWGLVPAWAKDLRIGNRLINARREALDSKPAFRTSLERRRCVVPAEGYFEWERLDGRKVPYYIHADTGEPLAFAGLYSFWRDPERADDDPDRWVLSATIITTDASGDLARIHDREPLVLDPVAIGRWLDPRLVAGDRALAVLDGAEPTLVFHPVSTRINKPEQNDPSLIEPA